MLALDLVNWLPPSVILTVVDRFSKFAHFVLLPKLPTARETADVLVREVFFSHGLPSHSHLDSPTSSLHPVLPHHSL